MKMQCSWIARVTINWYILQILMNIIIHCTRLMQRSHYYKERNFACFIGFTYLKNQIDTKVDV